MNFQDFSLLQVNNSYVIIGCSEIIKTAAGFGNVKSCGCVFVEKFIGLYILKRRAHNSAHGVLHF